MTDGSKTGGDTGAGAPPGREPGTAGHAAGSASGGMDGDSLPDLRLEMISNPMYLCGARELVAQIARRLGFDEHASSQIALALDEALANVIRHGYDSRPDGRIWISFYPVASASGAPAGIGIVVEDEARQIDPTRIKGRDLEDIRPGGLGVHIIREVMDEVRYEKREVQGMRLKMIKRHTPGAQDA